MTSQKKTVIYAARVLWLVALCLGAEIFTDARAVPAGKRWVATWSAGIAVPPSIPVEARGVTLREIVHTSLGGEQVRVRFSNLFGETPLAIGAAHVALRAEGSAIVPGSDHALTFNHRPTITIPAGAMVLSDPADLPIPALQDVAVSLYLTQVPATATGHASALQTSYVTAGDSTAETKLDASATIASWYWLGGVDVISPSRAAAVVTLGDSITDGGTSTPDTNRRWPNVLAARFAGDHRQLAVVNVGIGGNRILHNGTAPTIGRSALARFDHDVLAQPGVKYVIVFEGVNDLGQPPLCAPASEAVTANDMIAGLAQLIARSHEHGLRIFGATIGPYEGTATPGYYTAEKEAERQAINRWIRTAGAFDGVIDFDAVLRDPARHTRLLAQFDSGDHIHPSDAGMKSMGEAVSLSLFRDESAEKRAVR